MSEKAISELLEVGRRTGNAVGCDDGVLVPSEAVLRLLEAARDLQLSEELRGKLTRQVEEILLEGKGQEDEDEVSVFMK